MTDKEMNRAILGKLYAIAHKVFDEGVEMPEGSYTSIELAKEQKKRKRLHKSIFRDGYIKEGPRYRGTYLQMCDCTPLASVEVGAFKADFCVSKIFDLVAKFEKLAGVPPKDKEVFAHASDNGNDDVLYSVDVEVNKGLGTLSKFVATKREKRPSVEKICLDIKHKRAIATNCYVLQAKPIYICDVGNKWEESLGRAFPVIDAASWRKICASAGKGAILTCKLISHGLTKYWLFQCNGFESKAEAYDFVEYERGFGDIDITKRVDLGTAWISLKKWLRQNAEYGPIIVIKHEEGSERITFKFHETDVSIDVEHVVVPSEGFTICVNVEYLLKLVDKFNLYIPQNEHKGLYFIKNQDIKIIMPLVYDDEGRFSMVFTDKKSAFEIAGFPLANQTTSEGSARQHPERLECVECAGVANCSSEQENEPTEHFDEPEKALEASTDKGRNKTAFDADLKKFTFDKVGVNVGDVLTFVDGTEVTAAVGNKVEFCDKTFTLSGFCKEFMPDERRTKSNSYRGCDYFYKDGVKLGKLLKEYQKKAAAAFAFESKDEEVTSVPVDNLEAATEGAAAQEGEERNVAEDGHKWPYKRKTPTKWTIIPRITLNALTTPFAGFYSSYCLRRRIPRLPRVALILPMNTPIRGLEVVQILPFPPPQSRKTSYHEKLLYHLLIRKQKWKEQNCQRLFT